MVGSFEHMTYTLCWRGRKTPYSIQ